MNKYYFKAKDKENKLIKGYLNAENKEEIKKELLINGLYPISISRDYALFSKRKITDKVLLNFIQQWYALEKSNINSQDAISVIKEKESNKLLRSVLNIIIIKLNEGYTIAECFDKVRDFFPEIFVEMLNVGFLQSNMVESLNLLKDYYIEKNKNTNKIKNALLYPKILLIALFAALIVVSKFIVPSFKSLYVELGKELTGFSKWIFTFLTFIGDNLILVLLFILLLVVLFFIFKKTIIYKKIIDKLKLIMPFFNDLEKTANIYLFLKSTNILWHNNYNKIESIDIISRLLPNYYYQKEFINVKYDVEKGTLFGKALSKSKLFDQNVCDILTIGEEMNVLNENINNACVWYSFELQTKTERFTKIIEPLMIFLMAAFILLIILVIFIPMISSIRMVM